MAESAYRGPTARLRRADAKLNAEKIFSAALEVCAERGIGVGLPEVATRAGVGRTTVYRCFASRDELLAAVMEFKLVGLAERLAALSRTEDAWEGLRQVLVMIMEDVRNDRLLGDALLLRPDLFPTTSAASTHLATLLDRGKEQGTIHPDLLGADLRLMVSGVAKSLAVSGQHGPAAWVRAAEFIANSARAVNSCGDGGRQEAGQGTTGRARNG